MIVLILSAVALGLAAYLILKWGTRNHDTFRKQGLKYVKPLPIIGNSTYVFTSKLIGKIFSHYNDFPEEKVVGIFEFAQPVYFLRCPELIKQLTIKDFQHFQDHSMVVESSSDELFGNMLFAMRGKQWRDMRSSLSPMFTGRQMRTMMNLIVNCNKQIGNFLKEEYEQKGLQTYSMKKFFSQYTNDIIASCAFGVECDSMKYPNNEIYLVGQKLLEFQKPSQLIKFLLTRFFPKFTKLLGIKILDDKTKQTFYNIIINTMETRRRENIFRPDMLQLLMKLQDGQLANASERGDIDKENEMIDGEIKQNWTNAELMAQSFIFFLAGFDTTSTAMAFMAYELVANPDIQEKLIEEIDRVNGSLEGGSLTYDTLKQLKYMDMVISETLRKWPPGIFLDRKCVKDYTYEDENGLKFTVKEGELLWIPVYPMHMDPKYFPNPEKFDPQRFIDDNKIISNINGFMPFGVGPRNCIGFRFALMEIKIIFFYLLLKFKLKANDETQIPLKLKNNFFGLVPEKEILVDFEPRSKS